MRAKKLHLLLFGMFFFIQLPLSMANGEASTYFEIFIPPNNDAAARDVCLILTAIYDSTAFQVVDDDMDGDSDDSFSGILMAGQSYVHYIREGGVNDDAPHSGENGSKQDGDYFIVTSDKLILASQSTNSDWQHDWVPATNKTSRGERFIIYSPPTSYSNRDLNVFAYEDSTTVTIKKISWANQVGSGYTNVDMTSNTIVVQRSLNIGEDIIFYHTDGRDLMETGATYMVESNKAVTVQYGALWTNARDGGGYVPSSNGSSAGELFYFTVPFQANKEQEIRIVSWDDNNAVSLAVYQNNNWVTLDSWTADEMEALDWVSYNGNQSKVFRVICDTGKKVSVFEANWLETGSPGTSDVASMVSSEGGNSAGTRFLCYMAPPGKEVNVTDPFTGEKFSYGSHLYLFARHGAQITVKDANTNGQVINRTINLAAGRYADCYLTRPEWKSIYNGDGNPTSGSDRPYLLVESDTTISVFNTNFNDNWMAYFGTSQSQDFSLSDSSSTSQSIPGDTVTVVSQIQLANGNLENPEIQISVSDGASVLDANFINNSNQTSIPGTGNYNTNTNQTEVEFSNLPHLNSTDDYQLTTEIIMNVNYQNGDPIPDQTVISVETSLSGTTNGIYQQSSSSTGIVNETSNQSLLIFAAADPSAPILSPSKNSWGLSFADFDNNGFDDLFIPNYNMDGASELYKNNAAGDFYAFNTSALTMERSSSVAATWADYDNDGKIDLYVANNKDQKNFLFRNTGNNTFSKIENNVISNDKGYSHAAAWADYNNDGYVDMVVSDYFPTRFNMLYKNNGDGSFSKVTESEISLEATHSLGVSWADCDNDGDQDLFVANYNNSGNSLFINNGDGSFSRLNSGAINSETANSTGGSWADYDNDGDLDLFVTNASNQNNFLYKNEGGGSFSMVTDGSVVTDGGNSHGSTWGDMDNDGDLDLFVSNDQDEMKFLYLNNNDGTFTRNLYESATARSGNSFAVSLSDIERDGDLDLFVSNHSNENNFFYYNNGNSNHWFEARLTGTNSNRSAIGSRIRIKANIYGQEVWQLRDISSQSGGGPGAQNSLVAHFGLGDASLIDSLIIDWPSGYSQTMTDVAADQYLEITEDIGAMISGYVFNDKNLNCQKDSDENGLSNVIIRVMPGARNTMSNDSGYYSIYVPPGTYTVEQIVPDNWGQNCPASGALHTISVSTIGEVFSDNNFGNSGLSDRPDLWVEMGGTALRRGFQNILSINYKNNGTVAADEIVIQASFESEIIPVSAEPAWDNENNMTYSWEIGSLGINEGGAILISDSVDLYSSIGNITSIQVQISSLQTDINTNDNQVVYSDSIVGSVDPNEIHVSPKKWARINQRLHYTILFQNVGNYYASRIVIIDSLPDMLDPNTIEFGAMSHPLTPTLDDHVIQWFADDVYLPDSTNDEPNSHGFVEFTILPKDQVPEGRRIANKAHIQFDYNDFIITNSVKNLMTHHYNFRRHDEAYAIVFPNPVSDNSLVRIASPIDAAEPARIVYLRVFDMRGGLVLQQNIANEFQLNTKDLNLYSGIFIIELTDQFGAQHRCRAIVQK